MMALHCRSRAGPVLSALPWASECRRPQTRNAQLGLTMLHLQSSRMNRQKVVLHRARAALDKIHSASSIMETSRGPGVNDRR
jgi:hypothetical protein